MMFMGTSLRESGDSRKTRANKIIKELELCSINPATTQRDVISMLKKR